MEVKKLFIGLEYIGEVPSKRQTYYIFKNKKYYILYTLKEVGNAGNFTILEFSEVEYIEKLMNGRKSVKVTDIQKESKKPNITSSSFKVLSIIYVLIANKKAKIDSRFKGNALVLNFSS